MNICHIKCSKFINNNDIEITFIFIFTVYTLVLQSLNYQQKRAKLLFWRFKLYIKWCYRIVSSLEKIQKVKFQAL